MEQTYLSGIKKWPRSLVFLIPTIFSLFSASSSWCANISSPGKPLSNLFESAGFPSYLKADQLRRRIVLVFVGCGKGHAKFWASLCPSENSDSSWWVAMLVWLKCEKPAEIFTVSNQVLCVHTPTVDSGSFFQKSTPHLVSTCTTHRYFSRAGTYQKYSR